MNQPATKGSDQDVARPGGQDPLDRVESGAPCFGADGDGDDIPPFPGRQTADFGRETERRRPFKREQCQGFQGGEAGECSGRSCLGQEIERPDAGHRIGADPNPDSRGTKGRQRRDSMAMARVGKGTVGNGHAPSRQRSDIEAGELNCVNAESRRAKDTVVIEPVYR